MSFRSKDSNPSDSKPYRKTEKTQLKQVHYTKSRLPVEVVISINFDNKYKVYAFEKYRKSDSGRAFAKKRLL